MVFPIPACAEGETAADETTAAPESNPEGTATESEQNEGITGPETTTGPGLVVTAAEPLYSQYISWAFFSYEQPDFKSKINDRHNPQTVYVYEDGEDGWVKISTYQGFQWVNTQKNSYFLRQTARLYSEKNDTESIEEISSQIVNVIEIDGNWLCIDTWLGAKWVNLSELYWPAVKTPGVLLDVPIYNQRSLGLYSGCEIVATAMMINYTRDVSVQTLVSEMPYGDDPNYGYRGDIYGTGFTIYPSGLLDLVGEYLGSADNMSTDAHICTLNDIIAKLDMNRPVVAWVNGLGFIVHAICITGYDADGIYYNNPWTGQKNEFISYDVFYSIWNKPIPDTEGYENTPYCKALSY